MSTLDQQTVEHLEHLARLQLEDEAKRQIEKDLNQMVAMVNQISSVNTQNITPMAHPFEVSQRLRKDEVSEPNQRDELLKLTPQTESGLFLVPKILE